MQSAGEVEQRERTIERWLTFAHAPDEIAQLKAGPTGPDRTCRLMRASGFCGPGGPGVGTNESELCMHP